ncbi:DnaJ domain-containing protein [uncultured Thiodictyon sp.]|uniref:DnaJ domain-containing protein n=1 Tax=uncultured Thiodictyon sp. TaxID=1846217 RepID=UPI0025D41747|nr:DnaJ domain-containing protein [uncultured Thiodictyon sp.]
MSDPYLTLGLPPDADDDAVHAAYLAAVKTCPPERDPQRFQAIRAAYESLRTQRARLAQALFDREPPSLTDILDRADPVGAPRRPSRVLFDALLRGGD